MKNKKLKTSIYHKIVDKIMFKIEKILDSYYENDILDFEINYRTMEIIFKNKNKILITRQESIKEIWLATKTIGYHFKYIKNQWICIKNNQSIFKILTNIFIKETKKKIFLKLFQKLY